jgi:signal transduction histidine kinase
VTSDRATAQRDLLVDAMQAFAQTATDHGRLLDTIVRRTSEALEAYCGVALVSRDGLWLETVALYDPDPEVLQRLQQRTGGRMPVSAALPPAQAFRDGQTLVLADVDPGAARARIAAAAGASPASFPVRSTVMAPLRARGQSLGVLSVGRHAPGAAAFDASEVCLTQTLADNAALAIANARLLADEARAGARLRVLSEAARDFADATADFAALLDRVALRLSRVLGGFCVIRMVSDDGRELSTTGAVHHPDPAMEPLLRAILVERPQRVGEGFTGRVVETGQGLVVPVVDRGQLLAAIPPERRAAVERLDIASLVAVPVRAGEPVIAAIAMARDSTSPPFVDDDLGLLGDIAVHAGLAITNSRLLLAARHQLEERRRAEDALQRSQEQLRQSQKMDAVGRLAGGIAHDFNNLLSIVLSYSTMLIADMSPRDPMRAELEEIKRAGERATELTRQLLAFSRQQVIAPRVLDLNETVRGMGKMIGRLIGEDITCRIVTGRDPGRILADPGHVEQILMNLIVNARDAMPGGGTLTLETANVDLDDDHARTHIGAVAGPHVMLAVSDTGIGMDAAIRERIFEPFFTTKEVGKGTGLGLSTVFGIVSQNRGTITVDSEPGRGAAFRMYFPRSGELESPAVDRIATGAVRGSETVLLVEDDDQVRAVAHGILRRHHYRVLAARNAGEALLLCESHAGPIHLLLTDVVMPRMSGRELADRLAQLRPDLRVLYMSGYTEDAMISHRLVESGARLLQKPFTPDRLLDAVRAVLDAR